ncbi:hypothetical protein Tco_1040818 [Tanacetum coccineum]|uniref:Uncharacterized protein n=1 Tax=Tanacetum coccineum TaxID=301880 RepID=A0ABQ5GGY2_9ASTR
MSLISRKGWFTKQSAESLDNDISALLEGNVAVELLRIFVPHSCTLRLLRSPMGTVTSSSWPLLLVVPGLVTYLVASLTLDSARSCMMQIAFLTQRKVSSIPIVFSWGGSISPDSFLSSILLLVVIIVTVVIVVVTVVLVVVVGEGSSGEGSLSSGCVDITGDEDPTDEDGDNGMGDPIGGSVSLGGSRSIPRGAPDALHENSLQSRIPEKSRGSNRGDEGNTGDGGKTVGGAIRARSSGIGDSLLVALYACMTFIYGSSWKGQMVSEAERSLDESSKESEEVFPGEARE